MARDFSLTICPHPSQQWKMKGTSSGTLTPFNGALRNPPTVLEKNNTPPMPRLPRRPENKAGY